MPDKLSKNQLMNSIADIGIQKTLMGLYGDSKDPVGLTKELNSVFGTKTRTEPWEVFPLNWPEDPSEAKQWVVAPNWESNPFRYANLENVKGTPSRSSLMSQEKGQDQGMWAPAKTLSEARFMSEDSISAPHLRMEMEQSLNEKWRGDDKIWNELNERRQSQNPMNSSFQGYNEAVPLGAGDEQSFRSKFFEFLMRSALGGIMNPVQQDPPYVQAPEVQTGPVPGIMPQQMGPLVY